MNDIIDYKNCSKDELLKYVEFLEKTINNVRGYIEENIDRYQLFVEKRVLFKIKDMINLDELDDFWF